LSIVFAIIFIKFFNLGVIGICLGFIIGRLILSLGYPWLIGRFLGLTFYEQLAGIPRPLIVTGLLLLLAIVAGKYLTVNTWLSLALSVGLTTVMVTLLAFYTGLSRNQRRGLLDRVAMIIRPPRQKTDLS
jgi:hypothetical protein